ncbi:lysylphosphatidylglycerol synthase domain-containing protein [Bosea vestrisii]|uniref:lysylphosphatidylglycerol synthase domain-containing protein n=1 Tax=Bosea vestrisii TaxID=151416 RepID=UPI0024E025A6|nr:lysylphosphatidylglycerol synthase domain-containing protein [Bosea vestrisii]WID98766.1 lysylphosphatidylglycerol synthase domain-containing protein [Bosea vestrisii]
MTRKQLFRLINIAMFAIGIAALWYYAGLQWDKRPPAWPQVNWPLALLSLVLAVAYSFSYGVGWHLITRVMGIALPLPTSIAIWGYSLFGKYVPGNIVLVTYRIGAYMLRAQARTQEVLAAIGLESLFSVGSGFVFLLLVAGLAQLDLVSAYVSPQQLVLVVAGLAALGFVLLLPPIKRRIFRLLRLEAAVDSVNFTVIARLLAYYVSAWCIITLSFWLLCKSMGIDQLSWSSCAAIYGAAGLSGILAVFSPSGIGVREGLLVALLSQSVPLELALAVALASRINSLIGDLAAIGVGFAGLRVLSMREAEDG